MKSLERRHYLLNIRPRRKIGLKIIKYKYRINSFIANLHQRRMPAMNVHLSNAHHHTHVDTLLIS